jgi:hypothetical protein
MKMSPFRIPHQPATDVIGKGQDLPICEDLGHNPISANS